VCQKTKSIVFYIDKKMATPKKGVIFVCVYMCVVSLLSFEINFTKFKKGKEFSENEKIESIWVVMKKKNTKYRNLKQICTKRMFKINFQDFESIKKIQKDRKQEIKNKHLFFSFDNFFAFFCLFHFFSFGSFFSFFG